MTLETKYGTLNGAQNNEYYPSGNLMSTMVSEYSVLNTPYGELIPNYRYDEVRKKYRPSVCFDEKGDLESIYLHRPQQIGTKIGRFSVEMLTFYPNGAIKRAFPLYGQIGGYWTENDEYKLAVEQCISVCQEEKVCKPLCLHFYPDGCLQSVTLWSHSSLSLPTRYGEVTTRFGFELTEAGALKSIEPVFGVKLDTPNGVLYPFQVDGYRLHAEHNSLAFDADGAIVRAATLRSKVRVQKDNGEEQIIEPVFAPDPVTGNRVKRPLELTWDEKKILIRVDAQTFFSFPKEQVQFV